MPTSTITSNTASILSWDETTVHGFFVNVLNLEQYEDLIYEHGITGDVLSAMDHVTLADMGIDSLGHRLKLLRAVWEVKKDQGVQIAEDEWRPADAPAEIDGGAMAEIDRLLDLINEHQERILNLERDHVRMLNALDEYGVVVPVATSADGDLAHGIVPGNAKKGGSHWRQYGGGSDGEMEAGPSKPRRNSQNFPRATTNGTAAPRSSDSATFGDAFTPTTSNATITFDSPNNPPHPVGGNSQPAQGDRIAGLKAQPPPLSRLISGTGLIGSSASPPANTPPPNKYNSNNSNNTSTTGGHSPNPQSSSTSMSTVTSASTATPGNRGNEATPSTSTSTTTSSEVKNRAKDDAARTAKSFRVVLEDPCWKVLPAALKKYKINDDWKQYALFICFGSTERCLSYDEKPLMLFQKLKESGQKPVFMLRHIRDIKSPIAVAQQKQAAKLGLPTSSTVDVLPKIKPTSDTSISPTKASGSSSSTSLQPGTGATRDNSETPQGGHFPELPSPGLQPPEGSLRSAGANALGKYGTLVDKEGNVREVTYAVAIYPYIADRQDEFDVAVGATFVILSKAKGWYIVQKDPDGLGNIVPDQAKSGWVPAGCLLELSAPISTVSPNAGETIAAYPGLLPLLPSSIMSSSYPGLVLMDYTAKGDDELTLKEGENVKIYKKYCHWSYTIKTDTGERGWVPAWFIGKVATPNSAPTSGGTNTGDSNPNTATTLTAGPRSAEPIPGAGGFGDNSATSGTGRTEGGDEDVMMGGGDGH